MTPRTLTEELRHVWETDWSKRASGKCLLSQAEKALRSLARATQLVETETLTNDAVTAFDIQRATKEWYTEGLSPATITKRLNCLSRLGVNVIGCRPKKSKRGALKWWLNPDAWATLSSALRNPHTTVCPTKAEDRMMLAYIDWTIHTGLRVEETLRLTWGHLHGLTTAKATITVPGTKSDAAQATLPLSAAAVRALSGLPADGVAAASFRVFPVDYDRLENLWSYCRAYIGATDIPTATLKALRRNAARHLHIDLGMPIDMVRDYLRHENVETTMGYLKLVGGYQAEEMRRWVK